MEPGFVLVIREVPRDLEFGEALLWVEYLVKVSKELETEIEQLGQQPGRLSWTRLEASASPDTILYEFRMPHTPILGPHPPVG